MSDIFFSALNSGDLSGVQQAFASPTQLQGGGQTSLARAKSVLAGAQPDRETLDSGDLSAGQQVLGFSNSRAIVIMTGRDADSDGRCARTERYEHKLKWRPAATTSDVTI
jgi:hypothetical protein